jgi:selenocysteine lyase/cysteine desulfurase
LSEEPQRRLTALPRDAHRWLGTFPEGAVRASPGPFTTEGEIDAFVAAVLEIARAK